MDAFLWKRILLDCPNAPLSSAVSHEWLDRWKSVQREWAMRRNLIIQPNFVARKGHGSYFLDAYECCEPIWGSHGRALDTYQVTQWKRGRQVQRFYFKGRAVMVKIGSADQITLTKTCDRGQCTIEGVAVDQLFCGSVLNQLFSGSHTITVHVDQAWDRGLPRQPLSTYEWSTGRWPHGKRFRMQQGHAWRLVGNYDQPYSRSIACNSEDLPATPPFQLPESWFDAPMHAIALSLYQEHAQQTKQVIRQRGSATRRAHFQKLGLVVE